MTFGLETAAVVALYGSISAGTAAYGAYAAGQSAKDQAKGQQNMMEYNAKLAEQEAVETQNAAFQEERKLRRAAERLKSTQRMKFAQAGVSWEGSPMAVMSETASELEEDALQIRRSGQVGARGYTAAASLERMRGKSAMLRGNSAARAGTFKAVGTAVGGAGSVYGDYKLNKKIL